MRARFSGLINSPDAPDPLPDEVVNDALLEAVTDGGEASLALIDGYPRFKSAIPYFQQTIALGNHRLLGVLNFVVSQETSVDRMLGRGRREGERHLMVTPESLAKRYTDYETFTSEAIHELSTLTRVLTIDAEPDLEIVWSSFYNSIIELIKTR